MVKNYLIFFFLIKYLLFSGEVQAYNSLETNDSPSSPSYFRLEHMNDAHFFYGRDTNDTGFTGSLALKLFLNQQKKNRLLSFSFKSELYTKDASEVYSEGERKIQPLYFTEITRFTAYGRFWKEGNLNRMFGARLELGLRNKEGVLPGLMTWIQGGLDGRGGYHGFVGNNEGHDYLGTGSVIPFVSVSPSWVERIPFSLFKSSKDDHSLEFETGARISTFLESSSLFNFTSLQITLFHFFRKSFPISFSTGSITRSFFHVDGFNLDQEIILSLRLGSFQVGFNTLFPFGKENKSFVSYTDSERLMRISLSVLF